MPDTELPLDVPTTAVRFEFVRASGPGGQNVNKVATAVQLRLDVQATRLSQQQQQRLLELAGDRATNDKHIILHGQRFRTQQRNRVDVIERLAALIQRAKQRPKKRIATKPSRGAKQRRMDTKNQRGRVKKLRGKPTSDS